MQFRQTRTYRYDRPEASDGTHGSCSERGQDPCKYYLPTTLGHPAPIIALLGK